MDDHYKFLEKRKRLLKFWPWAGSSLLLLIIGLAIYFYIRIPLIINPWEVISRLESGTLAKSSLETMAVLLPIVFGLVFFLLVVIGVLIFMALANEKKYHRILQDHERER